MSRSASARPLLRGPTGLRLPLMGALAATAVLLGACGGQTVAANQGLPASSPTAQDEAALKSSVHSYFDALSSFDFIRLAQYSSGPLHQLWGWSKDEWGKCRCPSTHIRIQILDVTKVSANEAQMTFGASSADGHIYTGPLLATRDGAAWRVADYFDGGRDERQTVVTGLRTVQTRDGVQIRVVGLWTPNRTGDLWMIVSNHTSAQVKAVDLNVSGPYGTTASARGLSPNLSLIPAHADVTTDMGWAPPGPVRSGQRYILHAVFVNLGTGQRTQFDLPVSIPRNG